MLTQRVTVRIAEGIHAGIAHRLHQEAERFHSSVFLKYRAQPASLGSIISMLALGVTCGAEVEILADGIDEADALAAAVHVLEQAPSTW
jgi:phosphotransferase system HPr (HPr) family protein